MSTMQPSEMSYVECRTHMQKILETGSLCGLNPDSATLDFVQEMIADGWGSETAYKCRNSAASMANKISGDARYLRPRQTYIVSVKKPKTPVQVLAPSANPTELDALFS